MTRLLVAAGVLGLVSACSCGGSGPGDGGAGGGTGGAGGGSTSGAPTAAFSASAGPYTSGVALTVDGSASTDPDGDALTFSWDFGDGSHGGGAKLAHTYSRAGSFVVKLTVADPSGAIGAATLTLVVVAGPQPPRSVALTLTVKDVAGARLSGATVLLVGTTSPATSDAMGKATLMVGVRERQTVRVSKAGYADKTMVLTIPDTLNAIEQEVFLIARAAAQQLNAAQGGTLTGSDGLKLTLPANGLVNAQGVAVTGMVSVSLTPLDVVKQSQAFPGRFEGTRTTGAEGLLLSYGTSEFVLTSGTSPVQLAPGKTATIELPLYADKRPDGSPLAVDDKIPLWSLDEQNGGWVEEGEGTVIASTAVASGFAYRATVSHFSWWNADRFTSVPARPKPKCCIDGNADGMCDANGNPEYCWVRGTTNCASAFGCRAVMAPPAFDSDTFVPGTGGVALPMPADTDIYLIGFAPNLTHRGQLVYRGAANASDEPLILLVPFTTNTGVMPVTIPSTTIDNLQSNSDFDVWEFTGQVGDLVHIGVSRPSGSGVEGNYTVTGPNGFIVTGVAWGLGLSGVGRLALKLPFAGSYRIIVRGTFFLPSVYTLELSRTGPSPWIDVMDPAHGSAGAAVSTQPTLTMSAPVSGAPTSTQATLQFASRTYPQSAVVADGGPTILFSPVAPLYAGTLYSYGITRTLLAQVPDGGVVLYGGNIQIPFRTAAVAGAPALCGTNAGQVQGVSTASGEKSALWFDSNAGITASAFRPSEGWLEEALLRGGRMGTPSVASNGAHAALAYPQVRVIGMLNDYQLFFSRLSDAGWSAPVAVTTDGGQVDSSAVSVAVEPSGRAVLGWVGNATKDLWVMQSAADGGWLPAQPLFSVPTMTAGNRIEVASSAGEDLAVWMAGEADAGGTVVRAARFDGAAWLPNTVLRPFGGASVLPASLNAAADSEGNRLAFWYEGGAYTGAVYQPDAGWLPTGPIHAAGNSSFCTDVRPLAIGQSRGFTVAGCEGAPVRAVWTRTYDPTTAQWSAPTTLSNTGVAVSQFAFSRPAGSAAVMWWREGAGTLRWRQFASGAWSAPTDLPTAPINGVSMSSSSAGKATFFFPVPVGSTQMCGATDVN